MRRFPAFRSMGGLLLAITAVTAAASVSVASAASASAARARPALKASAKVGAGKTWTLETTAGCESDTFARHHRFTGHSAQAVADGGTWQGTKILTMTWTTGSPATDTFKAHYSKSTHSYSGTYTHFNQNTAATLVPASAHGCAAVTTAPATVSIAIGGSNSDTATVTGQGGITPTGTVQFYVCPEAFGLCSASSPSSINLGSATLSGSHNVATAHSATYTPPATPGDYCFGAYYSGSAHYDSAPDGANSNECFTVTKGTPQMTTAPGSGSIGLGFGNTDTATITTSGSTPTPTGTVTFYECGPDLTVADCTTGQGHSVGSPVTVHPSGGAVTATSSSFFPSQTGTYCFLGIYSGDSNYNTVSDSSTANECFSVTSGGGPST